MDPDIARWITEFLLRQELEDELAGRLLSAFPSIPNTDSRLNKTLILRQIQSRVSDGAVPEKLLDDLEMSRDFDRSGGVPAASQSMKDAYCAVAVECTIRVLQGKSENTGRDYFDAVVRIWKERIGGMLGISGEGGLVSEQLRRSKDEMEASLWDRNSLQNVLKRDTRNEALRLVKEYLTQEWEKLGPPFLHLAADYEAKKNKVNTNEADDMGNANVVQATEVDAGDSALVALQAQANDLSNAANVAVQTSQARNDLGDANVAQATKGDAGNVTVEASRARANDLDSANIVQADEADAGNVIVEPSQTQEDKDNALNRKNVNKPSLMERNSTACTFEWDESIDDLPETLPTRAPRNHSRSRGRREIKRWSVAEVDTLRTAISKYGHGNWKVILNAYRDVFEERTPVDLKDKWRNMTRR